MRIGSSYVPVDGIFPFRGISLTVPPAQIAREFSPSMTGVRVEDGFLSTFPALSNFGDALAADELPRILTTFRPAPAGATPEFILVTTKKQYKYGGATWTDISTVSTWSAAATDVMDFTTGYDIQTLPLTHPRDIYVTNGKDGLIKYPGTSVFTAYIPAMPSAATLTTTKCLAFFQDRMVLGGPTLSGTFEPQAIYWSDIGDPTLFNTVNSGSNVFNEMRGEIIRMIPMAGNLYLFTTAGDVWLMRWVGGDITFTFQRILNEVVLLSPRCAVSVENVIILATKENIYVFDGSTNLRPIGGAVYTETRANSTTNLHLAFLYHQKERNRVFLSLPIAGDASYVFVLDYDLGNLGNPVWTVYNPSFSTTLATMGTYDTGKIPVLASSALSTTAQQFSSPYGPAADGLASSHWETADITLPENFLSHNARWGEIEYEARSGTAVSGNLKVEYSIDQGATRTTVTASQATTSTWTRYNHFFDVIGRRLRIRFSNLTTTPMDIRWVRLWVKPEGIT